ALPGDAAAALPGLRDATAVVAPGAPVALDGRDARMAVEAYLTAALAMELRLDPAIVEPHTAFDRFGLDSVSMLNLTRTLETVFGALSKTLLYEHQSVAELAEYLVRKHPEGALAVARATDPSPAG